MGQRKVTILDPATEEVARIALFIEGKGLPETAKKFVDEVFDFFQTLADDRKVFHPCKNESWNLLNYRCTNFRKKYVVAYLNNSDEIIICDFALQKLVR